VILCNLDVVDISDVLGRSNPCIYFNTNLGSCSGLLLFKLFSFTEGSLIFIVDDGVLHLRCLLSNDSYNVNLSKSNSNVVELLNLSFLLTDIGCLILLYLSKDAYLFNSS